METDLPAPVTTQSRPYAAFIIRTALSTASITLLLFCYKTRPILGLFARERIPYFLTVVMLYVAGRVMSSWRWQLMAAVVGIRGCFREFIAYQFIGMFSNLFLPGLGGGDVVRAVYLGRRHNRMASAIASVVADRGSGLLGLFWLAAAAAIPLAAALPRSIFSAVVTIGAVVALGYLAMPLIGRIIPLVPGRVGALVQSVLPYLVRPAVLLPAIGLSLVLEVSLAVGQYILALGLGISISLSALLLVVPVANAFSSLPITLNGLGVREAIYVLMLGRAGVSQADAIVLGLLWFAATMLAGLAGAIAFITTDLTITPVATSYRPQRCE